MSEMSVANLNAELERARDLVRYARHYLHDEAMIDDGEFALLVADSENGQRVARLEGYDGIREEIVQLQRTIHKRETEALALRSEIADLQRDLRQESPR